jgi:hypothetical protein
VAVELDGLRLARRGGSQAEEGHIDERGEPVGGEDVSSGEGQCRRRKRRLSSFAQLADLSDQLKSPSSSVQLSIG